MLDLRARRSSGAVASALRRKLHEIEAQIHSRLLDTARIGTAGAGDEAQKRHIVETLDRLLDQLQLGSDLEEYLTAEALREMLLDRVHGYGRNGANDRVRRGVHENAVRFAGQIAHATPNGAALEVAWQTQAPSDTPEAALVLYDRIAHAGFTACLDAGGSIAHHYGFGATRREWFLRERGPAALATWRSLKAALDPNDILNPGVRF